MAHDAFISYSHIDKATADAACATLENAGIRCFIAPRDINPGAEWGAAIVNAIDTSRVVVVIFSASANRSRQISREVERAINAGIPVVPMRIEDVAPTESLAYFMSTLHWLDALTPPLEQHLQKLTESIKGLLQAGAAAVPPPPPTTRPTSDALPPGAFTKPQAKPRIRDTFRELMNFSYRRNWLQAIGWYLIFLVIGAVLGAVVGRVTAINAISFSQGFDVGNKAGQLSAIPYHIVLAALLVWPRPKDAPNIMLVITGVAISSVFGALGGLIPLAVLTTRPLAQSAYQRIH
jgi:hypothetical protein